MKLNTTFIPWSKQDDAKLVKLCEHYTKHRAKIPMRTWQIIAAEFPGRSVGSVRLRYGALKAAKEGRCYAPSRNERAANPRYVRSVERSDTPRQAPQPLPLPTSITAFVCGDPLPGRSALDKKLQEANA